MRRSVVKVGGSLLTLPDLAARLRALFVQLAGDQILVLAGGGLAADAVREWDRIHRLEARTSHRLAIDAMSLTASLLNEILPEAALVHSREEADRVDSNSRIAVLSPVPVLDELDETTDERLAVGWDCTSDSIAGWIAVQWDVESLVLVKSVDVPDADQLSAESATPAVDACFRSVLQDSGVDVHWCNLRRDAFSVESWQLFGPGTKHSLTDR